MQCSSSILPLGIKSIYWSVEIRIRPVDTVFEPYLTAFVQHYCSCSFTLLANNSNQSVAFLSHEENFSLCVSRLIIKDVKVTEVGFWAGLKASCLGRQASIFQKVRSNKIIPFHFWFVLRCFCYWGAWWEFEIYLGILINYFTDDLCAS